MSSVASIQLPTSYRASGEREIAVLRALGRLGIVSAQTLKALVMSGMHNTSADRVLRGMLNRHLIWRTPGIGASAEGAAKHRPIRVPRCYGLTIDGKAQLDALQIEARGDTLDRLITRDRRAPVPSENALLTDGLIAAWCASVIDQARRAPMVVGVQCQAHYHVAAGELQQTIGAVLTLIIDPQQRTALHPGWHIPWFDGEERRDRYRIVRFAIEADTGRASTMSLKDQASIYAVFTRQRVYHPLLGDAPRPIILVPPGTRGSTVASAWASTWPEAPALISSSQRAQHPVYGALWGTYYTVKDTPAQAVTLLGQLIPTTDAWAQLTRAWTPTSGTS